MFLFLCPGLFHRELQSQGWGRCLLKWLGSKQKYMLRHATVTQGLCLGMAKMGPFKARGAAVWNRTTPWVLWKWEFMPAKSLDGWLAQKTPTHVDAVTCIEDVFVVKIQIAWKSPNVKTMTKPREGLYRETCLPCADPVFGAAACFLEKPVCFCLVVCGAKQWKMPTKPSDGPLASEALRVPRVHNQQRGTIGGWGGDAAEASTRRAQHISKPEESDIKALPVRHGHQEAAIFHSL